MDENINNEGGRIVNPQRRALGDYGIQPRPIYFQTYSCPLQQDRGK